MLTPIWVSDSDPTFFKKTCFFRSRKTEKGGSGPAKKGAPYSEISGPKKHEIQGPKIGDQGHPQILLLKDRTGPDRTGRDRAGTDRIGPDRT